MESSAGLQNCLENDSSDLESRVNSGLSYDGVEVPANKTYTSECDTPKVNALQIMIAKDADVSYVFYPKEGKVSLDPMHFLISYASLFREIYCGFGCEKRKNCLTKKEFGVDESFSLNYVKNNFPINFSEGTHIDPKDPDSVLLNQIELYVSSRRRHIQEHEWIWGRLSSDEREEFLKIQEDILSKYSPVFEKAIKTLVLGKGISDYSARKVLAYSRPADANIDR